MRPKKSKEKVVGTESTKEADNGDDSFKPPKDSNTHSETAKTPSKIDKSTELSKALGRVQNDKLLKLYNSLCIVSLRKHPVLMYIGAWSFLESLSTLMGKSDGIALDNYLSKKKLTVFTKIGAKRMILKV
ncbi:hypothetical protein [Abyssogena phaseoliformis symbiont]|uniref:hypothetical protein n=1 Tax=Abyssogena phaseoliformis symbiont TaxID=596095 RepID=UPI00191512CD|nr:hypothetical protein [Abyssogena phaseoliformis symbiont]